jgi:hypothetical protein
VRIKKMHSILTTRVPFPIKKKSELKTWKKDDSNSEENRNPRLYHSNQILKSAIVPPRCFPSDRPVSAIYISCHRSFFWKRNEKVIRQTEMDSDQIIRQPLDLPDILRKVSQWKWYPVK